MFCRVVPKMEQVEGSAPITIQDIVEPMGRTITPVTGDGFCLLNAIAVGIFFERNKLYTVPALKAIILDHVNWQHARYKDFHTGSSEELVRDTEEYLCKGTYTGNICDLVLTMASNALGLFIEVWQESENRFFKHVYGSKEELKIMLHFKEFPGQPHRNHYNAITPTDCSVTKRLEGKVLSGRKLPSAVSDVMPPKRKLDFGGIFPSQKSQKKSYASVVKGEKEESPEFSWVSWKVDPGADVSENPMKPPSYAEALQMKFDVGGSFKSSLGFLASSDSTSTPLSPQKEALDLRQTSCDQFPDLDQSNSPTSESQLQYVRGLIQPPFQVSDSVPQRSHMTSTAHMTAIPGSRMTSTAHMTTMPGVCFSEKSEQSQPLPESVYQEPSSVSSSGFECESSNSQAPFQVSDNLPQPHPVGDLGHVGSHMTSTAHMTTTSGTRAKRRRSMQYRQDVITLEDRDQLGLRKGETFPQWSFNPDECVDVERLPKDIDGRKFFRIQCEEEDMLRAGRDSRYFTLTNSDRTGFTGKRRVGWCNKGLVCPNDECPFLLGSEDQQPNYFAWITDQGPNFKKCEYCSAYGKRILCKARKLIEYNYSTKCLYVYHIGTHSCKPSPLDVEVRSQVKERIETMDGRMKPRELQMHRIAVNLANRWDWEGAETEATMFQDRPHIRKVQREIVGITFPDGDSFDAVGDLKRKTDQRDPFFIYKANNGKLNGGQDWVFKTSKLMVQIGLDMDINNAGNNQLKKRCVFLDGAHNRVDGFKSFGMWVVHPISQHLTRLANMEMRTESKDSIAMFFTLWNECLALVKGEPGYKFNPAGFFCDELPSNRAALKEVYGPQVDQITQACHMHFGENALAKKSLVHPVYREEWMNLCNTLVRSTTVKEYYECKAKLDSMAEGNEGLVRWIAWWEARKEHLVPAFHGALFGEMNLAEVGISAWNRDRKPKRLVDACFQDVISMFNQGIELELCLKNKVRALGEAPSAPVLNARERGKQKRRAQSYGDTLGSEEAMLDEAREQNRASTKTFKANLNSKHRPPKQGPYSVQGKVVPTKPQYCDRSLITGRTKSQDRRAKSGGKAKGSTFVSFGNPPSIPPNVSVGEGATVQSGSYPKVSNFHVQLVPQLMEQHSAVMTLQGNNQPKIPVPRVDPKNKDALRLGPLSPSELQIALLEKLEVASDILDGSFDDFAQPLSERGLGLCWNPPLHHALGFLECEKVLWVQEWHHKAAASQ